MKNTNNYFFLIIYSNKAELKKGDPVYLYTDSTIRSYNGDANSQWTLFEGHLIRRDE